MKNIASHVAAVSRLALSAGLVLSAAPALAQGTAAAQLEEAQAAPPVETDDATGNEIVVTAIKREQTLQDTPVAVTVTTAETI